MILIYSPSILNSSLVRVEPHQNLHAQLASPITITNTQQQTHFITMASEPKNCFLVHRCNYDSSGDWIGRERVLACYSTMSAANLRAKSEINRLYQDALLKTRTEPPKEQLEKGGEYTGTIIVNDKWAALHRVKVYVAGIECESSYVDKESAPRREVELMLLDEMGTDEKETDVETIYSDPDLDIRNYHPWSVGPPPFPPPRGKWGCLTGLRFAIIGEQAPYRKEFIEGAVTTYGGELMEGLRAQPTDSVFIYGITREFEESGKYAMDADTKKTISTWEEYGLPVLSQRKLFFMIERLSGMAGVPRSEPKSSKGDTVKAYVKCKFVKYKVKGKDKDEDEDKDEDADL